jgi:hypothetical protein
MKALADGADSVTIEKKETGAKYGFEWTQTKTTVNW